MIYIVGIEHPHTVATLSAIGSTLAAQVLYQHRQVEANSELAKKQYVALDPEGVTEQQWRAAENHLRKSLSISIENPRGRQVGKTTNNTKKERRKLNGGKPTHTNDSKKEQ